MVECRKRTRGGRSRGPRKERPKNVTPGAAIERMPGRTRTQLPEAGLRSTTVSGRQRRKTEPVSRRFDGWAETW